mmetsp:Transcript_34182/g.94075  ORF Transcript_34182/g.94075 Transcript_34182/m.94075 type:complete len:1392 (-) Transcript_34182:527-4702(-)
MKMSLGVANQEIARFPEMDFVSDHIEVQNGQVEVNKLVFQPVSTFKPGPAAHKVHCSLGFDLNGQCLKLPLALNVFPGKPMQLQRVDSSNLQCDEGGSIEIKIAVRDQFNLPCSSYRGYGIKLKAVSADGLCNLKNYEACIDDEGVARFQLEITPKELLEADTETTLQINAMLAPRDLAPSAGPLAPTRAPSKEKASASSSNDLPPGWRDEGKMRADGSRFDHKFIGPNGKTLYSIPQVIKYVSATPALPAQPARSSRASSISAAPQGPMPQISVQPFAVDVNIIANKEPIKFSLSRAGVALPCVPKRSNEPDQLEFTLEEEAGTDIDDLHVKLLTRGGQPCPDLVVSVNNTAGCSTSQVLDRGVVVMPKKADEDQVLLLHGASSKGDDVLGWLILKPTMRTTDLVWKIDIVPRIKVGTPIRHCVDLTIEDEHKNSREPTDEEIDGLEWTVVRVDDTVDVLELDTLELVGCVGSCSCSVAQAADGDIWKDGIGSSNEVQFELTTGEPSDVQVEISRPDLPMEGEALLSRSLLPDGIISVGIVDRGNNPLERSMIESLRVVCSSSHVAGGEQTAELHEDNSFYFKQMVIQQSADGEQQCSIKVDAKNPQKRSRGGEASTHLLSTTVTLGEGFAPSNWVTKIAMQQVGAESVNTSSNLPSMHLFLTTEDDKPLALFSPGQSSMRCGPGISGVFLTAKISDRELTFTLTDLGQSDQRHKLLLDFDTEQGFRVFDKALNGPVKLVVTYTEPRSIKDLLRQRERKQATSCTFRPGADEEHPVLKFRAADKALFLSDLEQMATLRYKLHSGTGRTAAEFRVVLQATDTLGLRLGSTAERQLQVQLFLVHSQKDPEALDQLIAVNSDGVAELPSDFFKTVCFTGGPPQMLAADAEHILSATLRGLDEEASTEAPLKFTYTSDANIQQLLEQRAELLKVSQEFIDELNEGLDALKEAKANETKASQQLTSQKQVIQDKFDEQAGTMEEVTMSLNEMRETLKQFKQNETKLRKEAFKRTHPTMAVADLPPREDETLGFVYELFQCEDPLLARFIGESNMNVLVVLTTDYGREHFDGSRIATAGVAELDRLHGQFSTPTSTMHHTRETNWKPTHSFDPRIPPRDRFTASWALDHINILPPPHMADVLLEVKKQELTQMMRQPAGNHQARIDATNREIITLTTNDWGSIEEPGESQKLCKNYLRESIFARLIGDAVVLPTQRDAESYQVSLNSYPTLVTKDGHKFYVGAFRGTTAMADIGVEKFGQGDMYDNLRELYSLQDNVKEQEHLKELFAEYANATKELDAAQSAVAPLAQKFDSQLKKKETLDALNSEITLKLQVRDQGYGLRRGKATEEQDKAPVIAKLMDELNKLKGKLQQLQCHTSPDSISHNCRSRSQQSCDV